MLEGTWNFMYKDGSSVEQGWKKAKEFDRLVKFTTQSKDKQIVFRMEKQKLSQLIMGANANEQEGDEATALEDYES